MNLLRNDPELRKDFLLAKEANENQQKRHDQAEVKDSDQWITQQREYNKVY